VTFVTERERFAAGGTANAGGGEEEGGQDDRRDRDGKAEDNQTRRLRQERSAAEDHGGDAEK
jgi:hypothetical protein